MRLLALLLTTISLVLGAVAATTAYLPRTDVADELLLGLTLSSPAGVVPAAPDAAQDEPAVQPEPLFVPKTTITPEVLAALREAGVKRVRVKELPETLGGMLARWTEWWWFVIAVAGFLASAMLSRMARAGRLRRAAEGSTGGAAPADIVASMRAVVAGLIEEVQGMDRAPKRLEAIVQRVGGLQEEEVPALLEQREMLTGQLGLGGYARLMDAFSGAERLLNRAWSAAADGAEGEAMDCLRLAAARLADVEPVLPAAPSGGGPGGPVLPGTRTLDLPDVSFGKTTPGMPEGDSGPGRGDIPLA